jgi:hypothetical protein
MRVVWPTYLIRLHRRPWGYQPDRLAFPAQHLPQCSTAARAPAFLQSLPTCIVHLRGPCLGCLAAWVDMAEEGARSNIGSSQCNPGGPQVARSSYSRFWGCQSCVRGGCVVWRGSKKVAGELEMPTRRKIDSPLPRQKAPRPRSNTGTS